MEWRGDVFHSVHALYSVIKGTVLDTCQSTSDPRPELQLCLSKYLRDVLHNNVFKTVAMFPEYPRKVLALRC